MVMREGDMIARVIAVLALYSLLWLAQLGNYWFTFGLWPRSWWSFTGFWALSLVLITLVRVVSESAAKDKQVKL